VTAAAISSGAAISPTISSGEYERPAVDGAALAGPVPAGAALGLASVDRGAGLAALMPWFLLYGVGGGLLVPLTATILGQLPADREGVASGVLNVSREVFGLFGVTVLGAILSTRRSGELRAGADQLSAFLSAYQFTLVVVAAIVAVGVPVSLFALRTRRATRPAATDRTANTDAVPEPVG